MAERTSGWENCRPVRSTETRPGCWPVRKPAHPARLRGWLPRPGPGRRPPRPAAAQLAPGRAGPRTLRPERRSAGQSGAAARRPTAGWRRVGGDHLGQLDQRHGIARRLRKHLRPGLPVGRAGLPVQQEARLPLTAAPGAAPGSPGQTREAVPPPGRPPAPRPARHPGGWRRTPGPPASCGPASGRHRRPPGPGNVPKDPTAGSARRPR